MYWNLNPLQSGPPLRLNDEGYNLTLCYQERYLEEVIKIGVKNVKSPS